MAAVKGDDMSNEAHVMPLADAVGHTPTDDCCCGPRCEPVERQSGTMGWLYVHHSLDGREAGE